jgi:hypothetical protein
MENDSTYATNQSKHTNVHLRQRKASARMPIENKAIRSALNRFGSSFAQSMEYYLQKYQGIQLNGDLPVPLSKLELALQEIIGSATFVVMDAINSELRRFS